MCLYGRTRVCSFCLQTAAENLVAAVNSQTAVSFPADAYKQIPQILVPSGRQIALAPQQYLPSARFSVSCPSDSWSRMVMTSSSLCMFVYSFSCLLQEFLLAVEVRLCMILSATACQLQHAALSGNGTSVSVSLSSCSRFLSAVCTCS